MSPHGDSHTRERPGATHLQLGRRVANCEASDMVEKHVNQRTSGSDLVSRSGVVDYSPTMSVHFISGKPGGGKSLYSVKLIIEELLHGHRTVITNVPLKLGKLNEYLQREYSDKTIDLHARVRVLSDDEAGVFWTIRPEGSTGPALLGKSDWQMGKRPDFSQTKDTGVLYVIDEVHNYFNARHWMETGRDVLFYLSQHRKLGDNVVCVTQHIGNVDKQFRSVAQDYTYLRNLSKQRLGMFKLPAMFVRRTYPEPATPTSACSETGTFRLDVTGIAACYDTAQGVSIHGRLADKGEKAKGIPWYVPAIGVPLLLFAIYHYGPKTIMSFFSTGKAHAVQAVSVEQQVSPRGDNSSTQHETIKTNTINVPRATETNTPVYVTSSHRLRGFWEVELSNGSVFDERNGLEAVTVRGARILGVYYKSHPALVGESSYKTDYSVLDTPPATAFKSKITITPMDGE